MNRILIIGAGRSATTLISYLNEQSKKFGWEIVVGDIDVESAKLRIGKKISIVKFDVKSDEIRDDEIEKADLVISLLPAKFHKQVALSCLKFSKNLLTASYESKEMKVLENNVTRKGLLFLNEMGLDPGLDHMSAMKVINSIKDAGHELLCFESFTGGLVAPESDNNPWHYKISWNPQNVVLAGKEGAAKFIQEGKYKYIPYHRVFRRTELIEIEGHGMFEGYANRDSLKYIEKYNLQGVPTVYRGTLRRPGFCRAWNVFVQLGATDDSYYIEGVENMTYRGFINSFLYYHPSDSVELKLYHDQHIDQDSDIIGKLKWLGIFDHTPIGLKKATPAQVLEHLVKQKWQLTTDDKDMIVMWHKFIYRNKETGKKVAKYLSLVVKGEDQFQTAMSKTVGLPLGIAAKLILTGKIKLTGMHIPTVKEIYEPVLRELEENRIEFREKVV